MRNEFKYALVLNHRAEDMTAVRPLAERLPNACVRDSGCDTPNWRLKRGHG